MTILKVSALQHVSILDPYPMEGIADVTITMTPGEYREYNILHQQSERLKPLLDRASTAGLLTYIEEPPDAGGMFLKRASLSFDSLSEFNIGSLVAASATIKEVAVAVTQVFNGATESQMGIFIDGAPDVELVNYTQFDLHNLNLYIVALKHTDITSIQLVAHYTQDGATQGAAEIEVAYALA